MNSTIRIIDPLLIFLAFQSLLLSCCSASFERPARSIDTVYQLGDSTSDAGNLIRIVTPDSPAAVSGRLPYGETLGKPTGRFCDGLLIVDYISKLFDASLVLFSSEQYFRLCPHSLIRRANAAMRI